MTRRIMELAQDEERSVRGERRKRIGGNDHPDDALHAGPFHSDRPPDIEPVMFKSRREAREWCTEHHAGSPIREVGANSSKRATKPKPQELE